MGNNRDTDGVDEILSVLKDSQAKDLPPLRRAELYGQLTAANWTESQIAHHVGRSQPHVHKTLSFLKLSEPLRALVEAGVVSATLAVDLERDHGDNAPGIIRQVKSLTRGKRHVTAKDIKVALSRSPKSLDEEELLAISARLLPLLWHLDRAIPAPDKPGYLTLVLPKTEVDSLLSLREMLALKEPTIADDRGERS